MGTVKEICWSTKFRKQQKLANKAKTRDEPGHKSKDLERDQHFDETEQRNQNTEPSKIPRRIRMSNALKNKFKSENNDKTPQKGSRTELKRGSELSQVSVILTARKNSEVHCCKEVKEHCAKDCVDSRCSICHPKKEKCCIKGKCKEKEKEKKPEPCCDKKCKPVKCKRVKENSSICAIGQSVKANCCACSGVLMDYFNEVIRLYCCKCDTRVNEAFCELVEVAGCLCSDCLTLLKKLVCCLETGICKLQKKL